jgi:hypothetical protein
MVSSSAQPAAWTPSKSQIEATLQYLRNPSKFLVSVEEDFELADDRLRRTLTVDMMIPVVPDAPSDEAFIFIAAQPRRGRDLVDLTATSDSKTCHVLKHTEHITLSQKLIAYRFLTVISSAWQRAMADGSDQEADPIHLFEINSLPQLESIPVVEPGEAAASLEEFFTGSGKLRSLAEPGCTA